MNRVSSLPMLRENEVVNYHLVLREENVSAQNRFVTISLAIVYTISILYEC